MGRQGRGRVNVRYKLETVLVPYGKAPQPKARQARTGDRRQHPRATEAKLQTPAQRGSGGRAKAPRTASHRIAFAAGTWERVGSRVCDAWLQLVAGSEGGGPGAGLQREGDQGYRAIQPCSLSHGAKRSGCEKHPVGLTPITMHPDEGGLSGREGDAPLERVGCQWEVSQTCSGCCQRASVRLSVGSSAGHQGRSLARATAGTTVAKLQNHCSRTTATSSGL